MRNDVVRRGRLAGERSGEMMQFLSSMEADQHIADADVLVDIAHVIMLHKQQIIGDETVRPLLKALLELYEAGVPEQAFSVEFEDIHAGIESFLVEAAGEEIGGRLHIGRSRNDEVAACLRIRVREDIIKQLAILCRLRETLVAMAEEHTGTIMPGFTHFQHAQPTRLAHHFMAYEQAFSRDFHRLSETLYRVNQSPLGSAAFASTGFPVNREYTAKLLGFDGILENTMDAVASRDFALEVLGNLAIMMLNTSRLCEELILWSSHFIRFVSLDDAFCSTSSIMPQKKNPDSAEIMRAKAGSVTGAYVAAAAIMKALPMSYNRDLQELTPHLIRATHDAKQSTGLLNEMLASATFNPDKMREEAGKGYSTATDLADMLVRRYDLPFRTAHTIVAMAVRKGNLDLSTIDAASTEVLGSPLSSKGLTDADIADALDIEKSLEQKKSAGSPSLVSLRAAISDRKKSIRADREVLLKKTGDLAEAIQSLIRDARRIIG
jgi:argininosuccinate lyase